MKTLRSYVLGQWHTAEGGFRPLVNPSTEAEIARSSSEGIDFGAVLEHARSVGGPSLRAMTFAQRGALLRSLSKALQENRDELLELSRENNGTTTPDGSFDIDGASGTLAYYAYLGKKLGESRVLVEDDATVPLGKTGAFGLRHVLVPKQGVAVHINAFNFPTWGFAEKLACSFLAGMPVITKPATATALVTERAIEILVEANVLPEGSLQMICGGTGDLLSRLGSQDVFAFTGSADTALSLRSGANFLSECIKVNIEADSLNAAVLGPDVDGDSSTLDLFVKEVAREMTQKAGQKCTAVRRIFVPSESIDVVQERLSARLAKVVVGNPAADSVRMGPLATSSQLRDAEEGVAALAAEGRLVHGTGQRAEGVAASEASEADSGKGFFFPPTLVRCDAPREAETVHRREVFGPVATLMPYDGTPTDAAALVGLGGGTLVTSVYSDDAAWLAEIVAEAGAVTGRLYMGGEASAPELPGSGAALPQGIHGGPGRAGGGEELGALRGVKAYMQRAAVQGSPALFEQLETR